MADTPKFSGRLSGITFLADGTRRVIYDGIEGDPQSVALTTAEQAEVYGTQKPPPPSPTQAAEAAEAIEQAALKASAKADAFVQQFISMSPAQVLTYVNANVNNVADAKVLLTKMALMLLLLARKEYK